MRCARCRGAPRSRSPRSLTLALGIGATTAIFSVVYSVLIKPLPYPNSGELVRIRHNAAGLQRRRSGVLARSMYFTYRAENRTLAEIGMWADGGETVTRRRRNGARALVARDAWRCCRRSACSRCADAGSPKPEHAPAAEGPDPVILSYAFAQSRFGGDAAALGRELVVNGQQAQVVGIMPRDFRFLDMSPPFDIIVAMQLDPAQQAIGNFGLHALARLKPGVTPAEASADLQRMLPIWLDAWPMVPGFSVTREAIENWRITPVVRPLKDDMVGGVASALWVLMGAIGAVLLVACANIANLMLVRADARRQELAVRAALGAVPARIARELLVEALVIGARRRCARLGARLRRARAARRDRPEQSAAARGDRRSPGRARVHGGRVARVDARVRLDHGAQARAARGHVRVRRRTRLEREPRAQHDAQRVGRRPSGARARSRRERGAHDPNVSGVARRRSGVRGPGNHPNGADLGSERGLRDPTQYARLQHEILDAIAALPGVASAGFTSALPMEGAPFVQHAPVVIEGRPVAAGEAPPPRRIKFVSPGYLETMGTRIIAGRDLTWADIEAGGRVALISEEFARELGAEPADALGKRIRTPVDTDDWREVDRRGAEREGGRAVLDSAEPRVLAGVHGERFRQRAGGRAPPMAYVVRSDRTGTATLSNEIREAIWSVNRDVPIALERTMQDLYAESLARTSFALVMLAIAGVDGARARAWSGSTASSPTSSRSGRERSASGWRSARGAARFERCSCGRVLR